jgi:hypothetical protein
MPRLSGDRRFAWVRGLRASRQGLFQVPGQLEYDHDQQDDDQCADDESKSILPRFHDG